MSNDFSHLCLLTFSNRFTISWWAYTFPMTALAIATIHYSMEVQHPITQVMAVILSFISSAVAFLSSSSMRALAAKWFARGSLTIELISWRDKCREFAEGIDFVLTSMISLMYTLSFSKILSNALPFLHILMMPSRFPHCFLSASCFVFPSSSFFLLAFCLHLFLLVLRFLFLLCILLRFFFIRFSLFSFSSSSFPVFLASVFSWRPSLCLSSAVSHHLCSPNVSVWLSDDFRSKCHLNPCNTTNAHLHSGHGHGIFLFWPAFRDDSIVPRE